MLTRSVHIFAIITCTAAFVSSAEDYVAHEWGTFTSFQGSDGQVMEWRSLQSSELPKFVYDRTRPGELTAQSPSEYLDSKSTTYSLQRMETPVIYFYPKQEMVVDVSVRFPEGLITEWYPQVRGFNPPASADLKSVMVKDGYLRWGKIRLFPETNYPEMGKFIPEETAHGRNYFAARETDSAFVRVGTVAGVQSFEHEKFLFYRGVGNFKLPLEAHPDAQGSVTLTNNGEQSIAKLFILCVEDGCAPYVSLAELKPGETRNSSFPASKMPTRRCCERTC